MVQFLLDPFTDTTGVLLHNHVGTTGATWTKHGAYSSTGTFRITSNRVYPNQLGSSSGPIAHYTSGIPNGAEYDIEFTYRHLSSYGNFGVIFRASTYAKTFYRVYHGAGSGSTQEWIIDKFMAGAITNLDGFPENLTPATDYPVKIECRNATKKVYCDYGAGWVEVLSTTDNAITIAGRVGLYSAFQYADNEGKQIADIEATDLSTPTVGASGLIIMGD